MGPDISIVLVLGSLLLLVLMGAPIFLSLGFSSLIGMFAVRGVQGLFQLPASMMGQLESFLLVAVPLYILMGDALSKSGIGGELYEWLEKLLYRVPGGLAMASIFACALFGAMCGVSIAGVAAVGIVAVPEMIKRGYNKSLAAGAVTASGALAILIPPSISFIIYGAISGVSVGRLFIGGIIPGVVLSICMALYILLRVAKNSSLAPRVKTHFTSREIFYPLLKLWPVVILLFSVLGTIYSGITTPTEAGAIGAVGAIVVTVIKGRLTKNTFMQIIAHTAQVTGMILIILGTAFVFTQYLNLVRIPLKLSQWIVSLNLNPMLVIIVIMLFFLILGMFIDGASLIIVTTPVVLPTITQLGFDPLWYGIILVINIEIAVITPPVGLNLYAMKSVLEELTLPQILRGALPYVIVESMVLAMFIAWPQLATWLPGTMY